MTLSLGLTSIPTSKRSSTNSKNRIFKGGCYCSPFSLFLSLSSSIFQKRRRNHTFIFLSVFLIFFLKKERRKNWKIKVFSAIFLSLCGKGKKKRKVFRKSQKKRKGEEKDKNATLWSCVFDSQLFSIAFSFSFFFL